MCEWEARANAPRILADSVDSQKCIIVFLIKNVHVFIIGSFNTAPHLQTADSKFDSRRIRSFYFKCICNKKNPHRYF